LVAEEFKKFKISTHAKIIGFHVITTNYALIVFNTREARIFRISTLDEAKPQVKTHTLKFPSLKGIKDEDVHLENSFVTKLNYEKRLTPLLIA
jgi:hypothetical protein